MTASSWPTPQRTTTACLMARATSYLTMRSSKVATGQPSASYVLPDTRARAYIVTDPTTVADR